MKKDTKRKVQANVGFCCLHEVSFFLCPHDDSQGALRFAPVHPSVYPSVRQALLYRVCVINYHSFLWSFLKPCIPVVDILKMCMWVFGGARINFD